jgi:hypothetical protein
MKTDEYKDEIFYRVACRCGSKDCDMHLTLKLDRKYGMISMLFEKQLIVTSDWWDTKPVWFDFFGDPWEVTKENLKNWFKNLLSKIKNKIIYTWKLWIHGYIETSADLLFSDEKHIEAFVDAILSGKNELSKIFEEHRLESIKKSEEAAKNNQKESCDTNDVQKGEDSTV